MVKTSKGLRAKTRGILRKTPRDRGMVPINRSLPHFADGDTVAIKMEPSVHKGQAHRRFQGLTGSVLEARGSSYVVKVKVGNKYKTVIARPEHLKLMK